MIAKWHAASATIIALAVATTAHAQISIEYDAESLRRLDKSIDHYGRATDAYERAISSWTNTTNFPGPLLNETNVAVRMVPSSSEPDIYSKPWFGPALGFVGVVLGLLWNGIRERARSKRLLRLERVNAQVSQLYAPLFAISRAGADIWETQGKPLSIRLKGAVGQPFASIKSDLYDWIRLMRAVYKDMNAERLRLVTTQHHLLTVTDLVRTDDIYAQLVRHTYEFQVLMANWPDEKDVTAIDSLWTSKGFSAFNPSTAFPDAIIEATSVGLRECLDRQYQLLFIRFWSRAQFRFKHYQHSRRRPDSKNGDAAPNADHSHAQAA